MKKNYLYIFATALIVGFSSCSDFLDRYPQEELSDGSFWKTPDDANKVVSDLYGYLSTWDQDNDINSDNATMVSNGLQVIFPKEFMTRQTKVGAVIMQMSVSVT